MYVRAKLFSPCILKYILGDQHVDFTPIPGYFLYIPTKKKKLVTALYMYELGAVTYHRGIMNQTQGGNCHTVHVHVIIHASKAMIINFGHLCWPSTYDSHAPTSLSSNLGCDQHYFIHVGNSISFHGIVTHFVTGDECPHSW